MTGWIYGAILVSVCVAALVMGFRRGRVVPVVVGSIAGLAMLWIGAVLLSASGWHDADGWVDCYPSCDPLQEVVAVTLGWGLALIVLLGLIGVGSALVARRR